MRLLLLCLGLLLELGSGQPLLRSEAPTASPVVSAVPAAADGGDSTLSLGVNAQVTCVDSITGLACAPIVDRQCSKDTPLGSIQLQYIGGSCVQSRHTQGHHGATYSDLVENGPSTKSDAVIACEKGDGVSVIEDETMSIGHVFTLLDTLLSDTLTCTISSSSNGTVLQQFSFDTSGSVDLYVEDVFCSLKVVGCGNTTSCLVDAMFSYEISNTGSGDIKLSDVSRVINNDDRNLKAVVMLKNGGSDTLLAGETITVSETDLQLDFCSGPTVNTLQVDVQSATDDRTMTTTGVFEIVP